MRPDGATKFAAEHSLVNLRPLSRLSQKSSRTETGIQGSLESAAHGHSAIHSRMPPENLA